MSSNKIVDLNKMEQSLHLETPYPFYLTTDLIDKDFQTKLNQSYPDVEFFTLCEKNSLDSKQYRFGVMKLISNNTICDELAVLSKDWQELVSVLSSSEFIDKLSNSFNLDLKSCLFDISLFRFPKQGWVSPHIDNKNKVLTQLFYFNTYWDQDWGGTLDIMSSKNESDIYFKIPPLSMYTVSLPRTEHSWHAVTPLSHNSLSDRLSLQLEFWEK